MFLYILYGPGSPYFKNARAAGNGEAILAEGTLYAFLII
jgi:hypothetical protein